jgi:hypothetical protein
MNSILQDTTGLHPQAYEIFEKAKERIIKLGKLVNNK